MSNAARNVKALVVCAAVPVLCSAGCMISPQHAQCIGRRSDRVLFAGATMEPGQDILIEAWTWTDREWKELADVQTAKEIDKYTDQNAAWYRWPAVYNNGYVQIPAECWLWTGPATPYQGVVRARVAGDRDGLLTFRCGYSYSPFQSLEDVWAEYGHGDSVTVYAR